MTKKRKQRARAEAGGDQDAVQAASTPEDSEEELALYKDEALKKHLACMLNASLSSYLKKTILALEKRPEDKSDDEV